MKLENAQQAGGWCEEGWSQGRSRHTRVGPCGTIRTVHANVTRRGSKEERQELPLRGMERDGRCAGDSFAVTAEESGPRFPLLLGRSGAPLLCDECPSSSRVPYGGASPHSSSLVFVGRPIESSLDMNKVPMRSSWVKVDNLQKGSHSIPRRRIPLSNDARGSKGKECQLTREGNRCITREAKPRHTGQDQICHHFLLDSPSASCLAKLAKPRAPSSISVALRDICSNRSPRSASFWRVSSRPALAFSSPYPYLRRISLADRI